MNRKKRILLSNEASFLATGFSTYGMEVMKRLHATGKYELAELGSYASPSDPRCAQIPWNFYPAYYDKNNPAEETEFRKLNTNQFGEWKFEQTCLDFCPDVVFDIRDVWMCLTKQNDIITNHGLVPISAITTEHKVLTHTGKYRQVCKTMNRNYKGKAYSIQVSGIGIPVELTEEHPVLAIKRNKVNLPDFVVSPTAWLQTKDLSVKDIVCFPINTNRSISMSDSLLRLIGYYIAEGCIMYEGKKEEGRLKGIQLSFHKDEVEYHEDVIAAVKEHFNIDAKIKVVGNSVIIRCFGASIAESMQNYGGELSHHKIIHNNLLNLDDIGTKNLLCGIFRGDGSCVLTNRTNCLSGYRCNFVTTSKNLAYQVFMLCAKIGIFATFNLNNNSIAGKDDYERYIFNFSEDAEVNFKKIVDKQFDEQFKHKRIVNDYIYMTIRNISKREINETVYNFEVEDDNSYVSSFIVHNCEYELRSPFRQNYQLLWMPTVDGAPQQEQWIANFTECDGVFSYTDWGLEVLRKQGGNKIKLLGTASPGADTEMFCPPPDRAKLKQHIGFRPDSLIIGTVMRNQKRKLFNELIKAFAKFLKTAPDSIRNRTYLYIHSSYPDVGWDFPRIIKENNVGHRVLFTYYCRTCKAAFPSFFQDARCFCNKCGKPNGALPNTGDGVDRQTLSNIMKCFDLYVQYAIAEGFGMGMAEAAACGSIITGTDYSAMSDVVRKLHGYPIKVKAFRRESETHCYRAVPDEDDFIRIACEVLQKSEAERKLLGDMARKAVLEHYTYEKAAKTWENAFDALDCPDHSSTWFSPPRIHQPATQLPQGMSNEQFVSWAIINIFGRPEYLNSYMAMRMLRDLNMKASKPSTGDGVYINEDAMLAKNHNWKNFTRENAADILYKMCLKWNDWERKRWEMVNARASILRQTK